VGVVQQLRPPAAEPGDEVERVNVVRLVEYLGPISPELALVDPELAARARALLPDTPGIRVPRRERDEPIPPRVVEVQVPAVPARSRWRFATVAAMAAAASAAFGLGVSAAASGDHEASARLVPTTQPTTQPRPPAAQQGTPSKPRSTGTAVPAAPAAPRFVWAPQADAARYHFALYQGQRLIFEKDVSAAALELPRAWTVRGRVHSLGNRSYRWVVSPYVGSGNRLGPAIVSATYTG
jgi:hypothetical protein